MVEPRVAELANWNHVAIVESEETRATERKMGIGIRMGRVPAKCHKMSFSHPAMSFCHSKTACKRILFKGGTVRKLGKLPCTLSGRTMLQNMPP